MRPHIAVSIRFVRTNVRLFSWTLGTTSRMYSSVNGRKGNEEIANNTNPTTAIARA